MRYWFLILLTLISTSCASPAGSEKKTDDTGYPDLGLAPELVGDVWINTESPLKLADLSGKVVLLEMWTFDCINCRNVIPYLRDWYRKYSNEGLVVIGNHYPEYDYERKLDNLKQAVIDLDVSYPVVQDNEGVNWDAYKNDYWPTLYLIDKNGHIRYFHIGEGDYDSTETAILALLEEPEQGPGTKRQ